MPVCHFLRPFIPRVVRQNNDQNWARFSRTPVLGYGLVRTMSGGFREQFHCCSIEERYPEDGSKTGEWRNPADWARRRSACDDRSHVAGRVAVSAVTTLVVEGTWHVLFVVSRSRKEKENSPVPYYCCVGTPTSWHTKNICCPKPWLLGHGVLFWWSWFPIGTRVCDRLQTLMTSPRSSFIRRKSVSFVLRYAPIQLAPFSSTLPLIPISTSILPKNLWICSMTGTWYSVIFN